MNRDNLLRLYVLSAAAIAGICMGILAAPHLTAVDAFYTAGFALWAAFTSVAFLWGVQVLPQKIATPPNGLGAIYVLRRRDGVCKVGRSVDLRRRIADHAKDYEQGFDVAAAWVVPNAELYERIALHLTRAYTFAEGKRKELRQMTQEQLNEFIILFTVEVSYGFQTETPEQN